MMTGKTHMIRMRYHEDEGWSHASAHKAEHVVDLDTAALLAVTVQPGAAGNTDTVYETLVACSEQIHEVAATIGGQDSVELNPEGPAEVVRDKGYDSNDAYSWHSCR